MRPLPLSFSEARWIFLVALIVRLAYLAVVYRGDASLRAYDSQIYEGMAAQIPDACRAFMCLDVIGTTRMPLYPLFLAALRAIFGPAPIWPVLVQMLIDCGNCLLIAWLAGVLDRRLALLAGILACFNLNLITSAGLILTECLFMAPFIGGLIAAVLYLQAPSARRALAAGALIGLALMVRSVLMFFLPVLLVSLAWAAWRSRTPLRHAARDLILAAAAAALMLAPVLVRNVHHYGRLALVDQGGIHALMWVAPTAFEFLRGVPFEQGQQQMIDRVTASLAAEHLTALPDNPFAAANYQERVAKAALLELGVSGLARAWLDGAAVNLFAPTLAAVPPVAHLDRPHFYETAGSGLIDKLMNFEHRAAGSLFFWLMVPAISFTILCRGIELVALARIGRPGGLPLGPGLYLVAVVGYFVAITGPVTGVKYRLELEPFLTILLASGLLWLWRKRAGPT